MSKTGCISHKSRQQLVILREDYLAICDQNHCAAAILNIFEYWTDSKLDNREQAETENTIAAAGNAPPVADDLWIYKSIPELHKELLGMFGENKIGKALDLLIEKKLLDSRNNPKYGWDRTLQYQFNISLAQALISKHVPSFKSKASQALNLKSPSLKSKAAIPQTTTENTSKNSSDAIQVYIKAWLDGQAAQPLTNQYGNKTNRTIAKALSDNNVSIEYITKYTNILALQDYWKGKLVPFKIVGDNIGAYIALQPKEPTPVPLPPPTEPEQPEKTPEQIAERMAEYERLMGVIRSAIVDTPVRAA